jgi:hypothetical protein
LFASVSGQTAEQFRQQFQVDAAGAILSFIEGLGRMSAAGQNTFKVLDELGLSEIRVRDALLRASNAGDLFRDSINLGTRAWRENLALTKEAEQRYATSASQLQLLKNRLTDISITLGDALVPALLDAIKAMEPMFRAIETGARRFSELDDGTQRVIIGFAALVAALGPTLVIAGKVIESVGSITTALGKMSKAMANAGGASAVLSRALTALTGPVGIAIAAISALVAGGIALHRYMSKDAIPAVQSFGDEAQKAAQRASGSFSKFRQETSGELHNVAQVAKAEGEAIGENIAEGVSAGTGKAKDQAIDDMRQMVDRMKETVDRNTTTLNRLGDALTNALKRQYEELEKVQIKALDDQIERERKASDERIRIYDAEYAEKLKLIDEEAYRQVKVLQDQIDAIDKLTEAEDRARREQEYRERIAEYQRQLAAAETEEERAKIQQDMAKTVADYERQILLEQRKAQKEALREQIEDIKAAANERKEQLRQELEEKKATEKELLQATLDRLNEEKEAVKSHFDALTETEALHAEARKLIVEKNNDEIVRLLETYNPKWQDAGKSFADSLAQGLDSEKQSISEAVAEVLDIAPVIDDQIRELERLQTKLKELEKEAKGSSGGVSFDFGFAEVTEDAAVFAQTLENEVQPSIKGVTEAAKEIRTEALKAFIGLNEEVTKELNLIKWSGQTITEETAESIADKFYAMGQTILDNLEVSHGERLASMRKFFAASEALTEEEENKALLRLQESLEKEALEVEAGMNRVAEILSAALDERRGLKQEEYEEIIRIQKQLSRDAETVLGAHELEQKTILERMRAEAGRISALQAADVVKRSIEQRDGAVKAAEEQYNLTIAEIIKMRDEAKIISAEQADLLIAEAKRQRDEAIATAEEMHNKVVIAAQAQAREHYDAINWETGEVLTRWQKFSRDMSNAWNGMVEDTRRNIDRQVMNVRQKYVEMRIAINNEMDEIKRRVSESWRSVENFFKSIDLRQIGRNIMQGLIDGINDMWDSVTNSAKNIAKSIGDNIRGMLDIRSPSRVMMKIGEDTGEGLAIGLENTLDKIKKQAAALAAAAMPEMRSISTPSLATAGGPGTAVEPVTNVFNLRGLLEGAQIIIREEADLVKLAKELGDYIMSRGR